MSFRSYRPELAHLQTFLVVCRAGTIGKAAKQLRVSQPAVSAHLKILECGMHRKLLSRSPQGVSPTPAGETLRDRIEPYLDGLSTLNFAGQDSKGLAVIGGPADLLSMRVLPALKPLYESGIQVKVRTGIAECLLERLASEELDLVIATRWPPGRIDLDFEPLFDEEYILVGSKYWYDKIPRDSAAKAALALSNSLFLAFDEQLALIRDHSLLRDHYTEIFGHHPDERVGLYVPDLRALRDTAIAGAGVTVLPHYLIVDALACKELFELFSPLIPRFNTLYIARRRGPVHPRLQRIIATLKIAAQDWTTIPENPERT